MKRRQFLLMAMAATALAAGPAHADFESEVRRQLRAQGFKGITVTTTLLGRSKITASRKNRTREIIMNPRTGEILRDLWISTDGSAGGLPTLLKDDDNDSDDNDDDSGGDDGDSDGDGDSGNSGHGGDGGEGDSGD
jgi:hypothetical protein